MILTLTLNSGIDRVLLIQEFTPGLPMVAKKEVVSIGGKGLDASVVLRHLGVETVGQVFVAGENGHLLIRLLERYGITPEPVWVEGETRMIYVLAESRTGRVSHVKVGELLIRPEHADQFLRAYQRKLEESDWVICAGSIPPSLPACFCGELARMAGEAGKPFLIDGSREIIHHTLAYRPAIVKVNVEEFGWTFDSPARTLAELRLAGQQVFRQYGISNLVITCGREGVLAFTEQGVFQAAAPPQEVVNAAGAGDAVSAALAWRLSQRDDWPTALRWAAATAAAVVRTEGTADCRWDDVQSLLPQVTVRAGAILRGGLDAAPIQVLL